MAAHTPEQTTAGTHAKKRRCAEAALRYIDPGSVLGVGTGSTVGYFIAALAARPGLIRAAVSSSTATTALLRSAGIDVFDLNDVGTVHLYIDGADQATRARHLIKGGGGALTREKIVAAAAERFVCIIDDGKLVDTLGSFPLPLEVIPMARTLVTRALAARGGRAEWRRDFLTDNGNQIIDVQGLPLADPPALERELDTLTGVVTVGLFALRPADVLLVGTATGVETI
jgi:ribose 5-phosphate isomerase A